MSCQYFRTQKELDASVTPEQAEKLVNEEREREANRGKPIPYPDDGFINDYD